ncbi:hypothetical protein PAXRUDRAFT_284006 [Paxillus rubicundulus Ve08.2h10]|uniref:Uncharacterized protein n=1 Tax=Paxillus rubicundulus Ve08.2h10 TaxID=930991 RepID=A0A0D0E5P8_9AGAM|nr:hypothetical protein PAXRUDRAFT_284006 [Paxillus rubicundulus Ve08.2h10]
MCASRGASRGGQKFHGTTKCRRVYVDSKATSRSIHLARIAFAPIAPQGLDASPDHVEDGVLISFRRGRDRGESSDQVPYVHDLLCDAAAWLRFLDNIAGRIFDGHRERRGEHSKRFSNFCEMRIDVYLLCFKILDGHLRNKELSTRRGRT